MIFLYCPISSSKSIFGIVVITSPCPCWISTSVGCSFLLYCASPRTSPCLGRSPLVCFACRWLCSSACCWLCSSASCSSSLQFCLLFFSLSSYSCCFTSFLSPQARWLWFRVSDSHHLLFGCGSVCAFSSESLCGRLRLRGCPRSTGRWVTTTRSAVCEVRSERFSEPAARRCSPIPLCGTLSCVRLHNEGFHRGQGVVF